MSARTHRLSGLLIWAAVVVIILLALFASASSPFLQWRDPVYQLASFAGIGAFVLMLFQPLLATGLVPGLPGYGGRRVHFYLGLLVVALVSVHVGALWITSPPDVVDALLFVSPTPFSHWGVGAMWALFAAAVVASLRRFLPIRYRNWRRLHVTLVTTAVAGTVLHMLLIEGVMEPLSKVALCIVVVSALLIALARRNQRV
ncbi:MAG: ferric reductase-like transmembrane domain-containing protein [Pseudomonadota bacterium]